ncbi:MAG: hypothetical protein K6F71_03590 [Ruminococcus sp.]|uniref:hypothetical protein n=1 Tax=Ruminococcus sp. TaxID=41978 RepID=UPI0025E8132B|nr:hypothetical protein [Ruminococcus sp.]MCR5539906.1 hypothetical protein [Ruminococcus sp.]
MRIIKYFKKLSVRQKIEFSVASLLTVALLVALPVFAWFAQNKNLETLTKIQEPGDIIIRAGRTIKPDEADPVVNFEMQDIDIEAISEGNPQRYVFSVKPSDYNTKYDLQLAHTTNIPFTYTLYRASEADVAGLNDDQINTRIKEASSSATALTLYHPRGDTTKKTYYQINGSAIVMTPLNLDSGNYGRYLGQNGDAYYNKTYVEGVDDPELYAIPVYLQTTGDNYITHPENAGSYDYFILELSWDTGSGIDNQAFEKWNTAQNNKETDMIYITASRRAIQ